MKRRGLAAAALFSAIPLLFGYTEGVNVPGQAPARRANVENLVFLVDGSATPGQQNAAGETLITGDSDPLAAIRKAGDRWNAIADSRVNFAQFSPGSGTPALDGSNIITFQDNAMTRSMVGGATAVTSYFVNQSTNTIVESDVIFNPNLRDESNNMLPFSSTGQPGAFDIEATLVHEFGHVIGAKHTSVAGATMWQNGREGEIFARTLAPDDALYAVQAYPQNGALSRYGRIRGVAKFDNGSPIRGGLATAVNPNGTVVSAVTALSNGGYDMLVPPGEYWVYLDPANEPLSPVGLTIDASLIDSGFATTLFGGNASPATVAVAAGNTATADLTAPAGDPPLEIQYVGIREGQDILIGTGPRELPVDVSTELFLWGPGLGAVEESDVRVLGPEVALVPGSVRVSGNLVFNGFPALRLTVQPRKTSTPAQTTGGGSLGTILILREGMAAAYTGGIVIENLLALPAPAFSSNSVTNGASFVVGPAAPGEIISIFGANLGPAPGVAAAGFDDQGFLPTTLAGVEATFDGVPAPLFFVSAGQINLQVPYETAGKASTTAVITHVGKVSAEISLPMASAAPGVFFVAQNAPAILNQDGSLNSGANRESRGRAVIVYATGQGAVSPGVLTGKAAPGSPLSEIDVGEVAATIGGRPAQVLFAGLAPGFVGLLQINLLVPGDAPAGAQVPLAVTVRGQAIQSGVTVAIAP